MRGPDAGEVMPHLWVGAAPTARGARQLAADGVDAVVDLRAERAEPDTFWPAATALHHLPFIDHGAPSPQEVGQAAALVVELLRADRTVLVHCHAGLQRAPTVACAALMQMGWSLPAAFDAVTRARPGALPTEGQLAALRDLAARQQRLAAAERPSTGRPPDTC